MKKLLLITILFAFFSCKKTQIEHYDCTITSDMTETGNTAFPNIKSTKTQHFYPDIKSKDVAKLEQDCTKTYSINGVQPKSINVVQTCKCELWH